jgi:conjugal transfer pilus assembly protein TrbC
MKLRLLTIFVVINAVTMNPSWAQDIDAARAKSIQAMDAAMERARAQTGQSGNGAAVRRERPSGISVDELRRQQAVDPAELASQYREVIKTQRPAGPDLLVFVSTSLPVQTLKRLAIQTKQAGGIMVFRGITGGLGKQAFNEWVTKLKPVIETGANIQIDPESFGRYNVSVVPTYVIALQSEKNCGAESCAAESSALAGDVTLAYALEKFSSNGGRFGKVADSYLTRLERK